MQIPTALIVIMLVACGVMSAGCTRGAAPPGTRTPMPPAPDFRARALIAADLPACFSLTGEQRKTSEDVGSIARDLGWEAGYAVTFTCYGNGEPTVIRHSLAEYPAANIPSVISMIDIQDRRNAPGLQYANLTFSAPGMHGFSGRNMTSIPVGPGGIASPREEVAEIIFSRNGTLEVLRMSGPETNGTLLAELAATACRKAD